MINCLKIIPAIEHCIVREIIWNYDFWLVGLISMIDCNSYLQTQPREEKDKNFPLSVPASECTQIRGEFKLGMEMLQKNGHNVA